MKTNEYEYINELFDWYESLLTKKQKDVINLYYHEDYSLSEIAENLEISRSAVSDLLKRVTNTMKDYESHLHLVEKFHIRSKLYDRLIMLKDEEVIKIVNKLKESE